MNGDHLIKEEPFSRHIRSEGRVDELEGANGQKVHSRQEFELRIWIFFSRAQSGNTDGELNVLAATLPVRESPGGSPS